MVRDHPERLDNRLVGGLVLLGVILRAWRYVLDYPLWGDETMFAVQLLDREWAELFAPLDYRQVAPPLFLALEWLATRWGGFSSGTLRLLPLLCATASVPLFALVARRCLSGSASPIALAVFAVSGPPIRYAAEVKPYAGDLLAGLVVLACAASWLEAGRDRLRWLLGLTIAVPALLALSLPVAFVLAAAWIVLAGVAWRRGDRWAVALLGLVSALSVLALMNAGQYAARPEDRSYFESYWGGAFPPRDDPGQLLQWLATIHTGPLLAYPLGGAGFGGVTALVACLVGAAALARRRPAILALLILPFALTLAAAWFRRYPYGHSARTCQFLAPAAVLLIGAGLDVASGRLNHPAFRRATRVALLAGLVALGLVRAARDAQHPSRTPADAQARDFARRFWAEQASDAVLVCALEDLKVPLREGRWAYDAADIYRCHQRIFFDRRRQGQPPDWSAVSATRPLRVVLINRRPREAPAFRAWMSAHAARYRLAAVTVHQASPGSRDEPPQMYVTCDFVPVGGGDADGHRWNTD